MSERPKWMPEFLPKNWPPGDVSRGYYETGLRAQLAVLEEMPVPTVQVGNKVHLCSDDMRWVMRKIASLRKELEG